MKEKLLESHYILADKTIVVVLDYKVKDLKAKKYMWSYKTGEYKDPIILYNYQKNVKHLYCLAHIRKKYFDIVSKLKSEALKNSEGTIGFNYCAQIYKLEKNLVKPIQLMQITMILGLKKKLKS